MLNTLCSPCFKGGQYWKELPRAQAHSSHRQLEEQTVIWEKAIQDLCQRPLNTSQCLKSNLSIKNPKVIEKRAVMISKETPSVWPKALYTLCGWKARASFLLRNASLLARLSTIPWLACGGPGAKRWVIPWAAEVLHRPKSFSVDCSRLFLSQTPRGLLSLFFKATTEIM